MLISILVDISSGNRVTRARGKGGFEPYIFQTWKTQNFAKTQGKGLKRRENSLAAIIITRTRSVWEGYTWSLFVILSTGGGGRTYTPQLGGPWLSRRDPSCAPQPGGHPVLLSWGTSLHTSAGETPAHLSRGTPQPGGPPLHTYVFIHTARERE